MNATDGLLSGDHESENYTSVHFKYNTELAKVEVATASCCQPAEPVSQTTVM